MDLEAKRKFLLENLEEVYTKIRKWEKYIGPGIKRKIQRLLSLPEIYIPYVYLSILKPKNFRFSLFNKRKISLDINDRESALLSTFKCLHQISEYKLIKFLIKNLHSEDIFYDIGGNYGFYTYLALEFCREVHYFEPLPYVFENVRRNLQHEVKVHLNNIALSSESGEITMYFDQVYSGRSTIIPKVGKSLGKINEIKVQALTLDEYIRTNTKPTTLKMDVEGAEAKVIDGGINFLQTNSPIIAMEVWGGEKREIALVAVKKLRQLGYKLYYIDLNGDIVQTNDCPFSEEGDNFIFMK